MSNHGSTEEIANRSSSENVEGEEVSELQSLTQETVNEQIRGFIAPLTRQLEELTRLVQGMATSRHPNPYARTELGTTSGTAMPQSDSLQFNKFCNYCPKSAILFLLFKDSNIKKRKVKCELRAEDDLLPKCSTEIIFKKYI